MLYLDTRDTSVVSQTNHKYPKEPHGYPKEPKEYLNYTDA